MPVHRLNWEQAVQWLREQPDQQALVRFCYYDDPLLQAAARFAQSEEWQSTRRFLPGASGRALDLGAGRGVSSYALACDGWQVTALEPDPSALVGAEAIRELARQSGLVLKVVEKPAEALPFDDAAFDLVYARQVLHHARDLPALCREVARVLRPGGRFIAVREHVISQEQDQSIFLELHPLHRLYGGEHAALLKEYTSAIRHTGLRLQKTLGPFDSPINYFPMTRSEWWIACRRPLARLTGDRVARFLTGERRAGGRLLLHALASLQSNLDHTPGRLYSFVSEKPAK